MPARIHQRRLKGWRKPPGAVAVTRGTRWGKPFKIGVDGRADEVVARHRQWVYQQPEMLAAIKAEKILAAASARQALGGFFSAGGGSGWAAARLLDAA